MKRICLLLSVFFILSISFGQNDTTKKDRKIIFGLSVGALTSSSSQGMNYFLYCTVTAGRHLFGIGPVFGPDLVPGYSGWGPDPNHLKLNGIHFSYQLHPNKVSKVIDFFFHYQFIYLIYKVSYTGNLDYFTQTTKDFETLIGYGFKVKFLKNFYLHQCIGIGMLYEEELNHYTLYPNQKYNRQDVSLMVNLGLGYKFNYQKRKPKDKKNYKIEN